MRPLHRDEWKMDAIEEIAKMAGGDRQLINRVAEKLSVDYQAAKLYVSRWEQYQRWLNR